MRNLQTLDQNNIILYRTGQSTLPDEDLIGLTVETRLAEALKKKPDIAIIANPTTLHMETALACARAGCHLLIEKPLSHSRKGYSELKDLVERQQLITMIGCQFRFHPLLISFNNQMKKGRIGNILGARAEWGEFLPNWHPWEDYRSAYSARKELGGGALLTLIHPLDYFYWFFGEAEKLHATTRKIPSLETGVDDDMAEIIVEFKSGIAGHVHLDYIQRPAVHTLTVWGDNGRANWDYHKGTLNWEATDGSVQIEKVPDNYSRNSLFVSEIKHFLACVKKKKPTRVPLSDGMAVLEMVLKAKQNALKRC